MFFADPHFRIWFPLLGLRFQKLQYISMAVAAQFTMGSHTQALVCCQTGGCFYSPSHRRGKGKADASKNLISWSVWLHNWGPKILSLSHHSNSARGQKCLMKTQPLSLPWHTPNKGYLWLIIVILSQIEYPEQQPELFARPWLILAAQALQPCSLFKPCFKQACAALHALEGAADGARFPGADVSGCVPSEQGRLTGHTRTKWRRGSTPCRPPTPSSSAARPWGTRRRPCGGWKTGRSSSRSIALEATR